MHKGLGWSFGGHDGSDLGKVGDRKYEWGGNHVKNNARMIREMSGQEVRTARFRCVMVLAEAGEVLAHFEESGGGGFGYDPLFAPEGYDQSFAELGAEVKNSMSHRGRALAMVVAWLEGRG